MKKILILTALGILSAPALAVDVTAALDIAKKSGCMSCHGIDNKIVGPAWKDINKKYAGNPAAEAQLIAKVKNGSKDAWGPIPMPPNATVKDADVKTMVQYILTLK
ncbi:MAG: c-type cytochrome [Telluria sp.]|nr:c-type cytochrome [Telluria sp.]